MFDGECARRFEQSIANGLRGIDHYQRLVDQRRQVLEHRPLVVLVVRASRLRELHREAAAEYAQSPEHGALRLVEQAVTPIHRRAKRLVATQRRARSCSEQQEALAQVRVHPAQAEERHPRRGKFDCEWQAVELPAQIDRKRQIGVLDLEVVSRRSDARLEQHERAVFAGARHRGVAWHGQRLETKLLLGLHVQGLLARGEHAKLGRSVQQTFDDRCKGREEVLAIVENEQHLSARHRIDEASHARFTLGDAQAQRLRQGMHQQRRIAQAGQFDQGHAVSEMDALGRAHDLRQAALADATGAHQRHETMCRKQARQQGHLVGAPDQRWAGCKPLDAGRGRPRFVRSRLVIGCCIDERRHEAVTPSGDRGNCPCTKQLAQAADLHRQVALFDHHARPHDVQQLALEYDPVPPLDQREQQVERPRADLALAPIHAQHALSGLHLSRQESIGLVRHPCSV
ncbi:MAG: hypothetical protein ABI460_13010 [Caldimonas sp.]